MFLIIYAPVWLRLVLSKGIKLSLFNQWDGDGTEKGLWWDWDGTETGLRQDQDRTETGPRWDRDGTKTGLRRHLNITFFENFNWFK